MIGENLLETAHRNDVELEGACEGSLACSTCHVVFEDEAVFETLPEACDDENDMLDLAYGLTATSRLGCQVTLERRSVGGMRSWFYRARRGISRWTGSCRNRTERGRSEGGSCLGLKY